MVAPIKIHKLGPEEIEANRQMREAARMTLERLRVQRGITIEPWEKRFADASLDMLPVWQEASALLEWCSDVVSKLYQINGNLNEMNSPAVRLVLDLLYSGKQVLVSQVVLASERAHGEMGT
jgi:hypothetical protein